MGIEEIKKAKEVLSRSQKKNRKVHCVVLRRTYRDVARKDNSAKNLKSYFRVKIFRKKKQKVSLRMTELLLVHRFFVSPSGKQGSE